MAKDLWRTPMISPSARSRGHFELGRACEPARRSSEWYRPASKFWRMPVYSPLPSCSTGDTLPCMRRGGAHHLAAEYLDQGLMSETDAEYRNAPGECFDHSHGDARILAACRVRVK